MLKNIEMISLSLSRRIVFNHFWFILILPLLLTVIITEVSMAVGVSPLVINLEAKPGETSEFEFTLISSSTKEEEHIKVSFYQPAQTLDGGMVYLEPEQEKFPAVEWVNLEENSVLVKRGKNVTIKGNVQVPYGTGGSHTVILMVEPEISKESKGITFRFRYAIRLNIRIQSPALRVTADLKEDWGLVKDEQEKPVLRALFHNTSAWDYLVSGEATIRNELGMLVERVELLSPVALNSGYDVTRVYPGSTVEHLAPLNNLSEPGKYIVRLFFKYSEYGQLIERKEIEIEVGEFEFPEVDSKGCFSVTPAELNLTLKPGQSKTEVLELATKIEDKFKIEAELIDINQDYEYSALEMIKLRTSPQFSLIPKSKGRSVLTFLASKDIEPGSYHGYLKLTAYSLETEELLTTKKIPLSVLVEGGYYDVEINSLYLLREEGGHLISLDLYNNGDVFLTPEVELKIMDQEGNLLDNVILELPEEVSMIMPLKSGRVIGKTEKDIQAGEYTAQITVNNKDDVLDTDSQSFLIEKEDN
jgi:hypothetical protein